MMYEQQLQSLQERLKSAHPSSSKSSRQPQAVAITKPSEGTGSSSEREWPGDKEAGGGRASEARQMQRKVTRVTLEAEEEEEEEEKKRRLLSQAPVTTVGGICGR